MPGLIPLVLNTECISSSPSSPPRRSVCLSPTSATMPASSRAPTPLVLDFSTVLDVSFPVPKPSPKTPSFPKPTYPVRRSSLASMSSERTPSRAICTSPSTRKAPLSLPSLPSSSSSDFASPTTPPSPSCSSPKSSLLMSTSLASIPYTAAEWCKAIAEVKRQFHGRQYRECAARCTEILENVRDLSQVEPIYVISLNFYAASALEANALSLPSSSAFRMSLLQKSRSHYLKTSDLLQDADDGTSESWRRLSVSTSSSSISTPISSLSRTWTPSMCSSSRSPSICSLEEPKDVPAPPIKKRVTFSCDLEDPVIRPDSPTLGFDDFLGRESPEPVIIPRVPMHITTMPPSALKQPKPASPASSAGSPIFESHSFFDSEIPVSRLCALLSSLRLEVASHLAAVEAMVSAPEQDRNVSTSASSGRSTPIEAFKDSSEMRSLDIKARIERLRSNNWKRRRFDAGKYRALAASALAELE